MGDFSQENLPGLIFHPNQIILNLSEEKQVKNAIFIEIESPQVEQNLQIEVRINEESGQYMRLADSKEVKFQLAPKEQKQIELEIEKNHFLSDFVDWITIDVKNLSLQYRIPLVLIFENLYQDEQIQLEKEIKSLQERGISDHEVKEKTQILSLIKKSALLVSITQSQNKRIQDLIGQLKQTHALDFAKIQNIEIDNKLLALENEKNAWGNLILHQDMVINNLNMQLQAAKSEIYQLKQTILSSDQNLVDSNKFLVKQNFENEEIQHNESPPQSQIQQLIESLAEKDGFIAILLEQIRNLQQPTRYGSPDDQNSNTSMNSREISFGAQGDSFLLKEALASDFLQKLEDQSQVDANLERISNKLNNMKQKHEQIMNENQKIGKHCQDIMNQSSNNNSILESLRPLPRDYKFPEILHSMNGRNSSQIGDSGLSSSFLQMNAPIKQILDEFQQKLSILGDQNYDLEQRLQSSEIREKLSTQKIEILELSQSHFQQELIKTQEFLRNKDDLFNKQVEINQGLKQTIDQLLQQNQNDIREMLQRVNDQSQKDRRALVQQIEAANSENEKLRFKEEKLQKEYQNRESAEQSQYQKNFDDLKLQSAIQKQDIQKKLSEKETRVSILENEQREKQKKFKQILNESKLQTEKILKENNMLLDKSNSKINQLQVSLQQVNEQCEQQLESFKNESKQTEQDLKNQLVNQDREYLNLQLILNQKDYQILKLKREISSQDKKSIQENDGINNDGKSLDEKGELKIKNLQLTSRVESMESDIIELQNLLKQKDFELEQGKKNIDFFNKIYQGEGKQEKNSNQIDMNQVTQLIEKNHPKSNNSENYLNLFGCEVQSFILEKEQSLKEQQIATLITLNKSLVEENQRARKQIIQININQMEEVEKSQQNINYHQIQQKSLYSQIEKLKEIFQQVQKQRFELTQQFTIERSELIKVHSIELERLKNELNGQNSSQMLTSSPSSPSQQSSDFLGSHKKMNSVDSTNLMLEVQEKNQQLLEKNYQLNELDFQLKKIFQDNSLLIGKLEDSDNRQYELLSQIEQQRQEYENQIFQFKNENTRNHDIILNLENELQVKNIEIERVNDVLNLVQSQSERTIAFSQSEGLAKEETYQAEIQDLNNRLTQLTRKQTELMENLNNQNREKLNELMNVISENENKLVDQSFKISELENEKLSLNNENNYLKETNILNEKQIKDLKENHIEQTQELESKYRQLEIQHDLSIKSGDEHKNNLELAKIEIENQKQLLDLARSQLQERVEKISGDSQQTILGKQTEIEQLKNAIQKSTKSHREEINHVETEQNQIKEQLNNQIRQLQSELVQQTFQIKELSFLNDKLAAENQEIKKNEVSMEKETNTTFFAKETTIRDLEVENVKLSEDLKQDQHEIRRLKVQLEKTKQFAQSSNEMIQTLQTENDSNLKQFYQSRLQRDQKIESQFQRLREQVEDLVGQNTRLQSALDQQRHTHNKERTQIINESEGKLAQLNYILNDVDLSLRRLKEEKEFLSRRDQQRQEEILKVMDKNTLDISEYMKLNLELKLNFDQIKQRENQLKIQFEQKDREYSNLNRMLQNLKRDQINTDEKNQAQFTQKIEQKNNQIAQLEQNIRLFTNTHDQAIKRKEEYFQKKEEETQLVIQDLETKLLNGNYQIKQLQFQMASVLEEQKFADQSNLDLSMTSHRSLFMSPRQSFIKQSMVHNYQSEGNEKNDNQILDNLNSDLNQKTKECESLKKQIENLQKDYSSQIEQISKQKQVELQSHYAKSEKIKKELELQRENKQQLETYYQDVLQKKDQEFIFQARELDKVLDENSALQFKNKSFDIKELSSEKQTPMSQRKAIDNSVNLDTSEQHNRENLLNEKNYLSLQVETKRQNELRLQREIELKCQEIELVNSLMEMVKKEAKQKLEMYTQKMDELQKLKVKVFSLSDELSVQQNYREFAEKGVQEYQQSIQLKIQCIKAMESNEKQIQFQNLSLQEKIQTLQKQALFKTKQIKSQKLQIEKLKGENTQIKFEITTNEANYHSTQEIQEKEIAHLNEIVQIVNRSPSGIVEKFEEYSKRKLIKEGLKEIQNWLIQARVNTEPHSQLKNQLKSHHLLIENCENILKSIKTQSTKMELSIVEFLEKSDTKTSFISQIMTLLENKNKISENDRNYESGLNQKNSQLLESVTQQVESLISNIKIWVQKELLNYQSQIQSTLSETTESVEQFANEVFQFTLDWKEKTFSQWLSVEKFFIIAENLEKENLTLESELDEIQQELNDKHVFIDSHNSYVKQIKFQLQEKENEIKQLSSELQKKNSHLQEIMQIQNRIQTLQVKSEQEIQKREELISELIHLTPRSNYLKRSISPKKDDQFFLITSNDPKLESYSTQSQNMKIMKIAADSPKYQTQQSQESQIFDTQTSVPDSNLRKPQIKDFKTFLTPQGNIVSIPLFQQQTSISQKEFYQSARPKISSLNDIGEQLRKIKKEISQQRENASSERITATCSLNLNSSIFGSNQNLINNNTILIKNEYEEMQDSIMGNELTKENLKNYITRAGSMLNFNEKLNKIKPYNKNTHSNVDLISNQLKINNGNNEAINETRELFEQCQLQNGRREHNASDPQLDQNFQLMNSAQLLYSPQIGPFSVQTQKNPMINTQFSNKISKSKKAAFQTEQRSMVDTKERFGFKDYESSESRLQTIKGSSKQNNSEIMSSTSKLESNQKKYFMNFQNLNTVSQVNSNQKSKK